MTVYGPLGGKTQNYNETINLQTMYHFSYFTFFKSENAKKSTIQQFHCNRKSVLLGQHTNKKLGKMIWDDL